MELPKDPMILLSFINTRLRDSYPSLEELGKSMDLDIAALKEQLEKFGYGYDSQMNQFRRFS